MSVVEDEDIPQENDNDIPEDESTSVAGVAITKVQARKQSPKQIGFKPKRQRFIKPKGRPRGIESKRCVIPMRISKELHQRLTSEKTPNETYDQCALRLIKETSDLRIELQMLKQKG